MSPLSKKISRNKFRQTRSIKEEVVVFPSQKTEELFFKALKSQLKINTFKIKIVDLKGKTDLEYVRNKCNRSIQNNDFSSDANFYLVRDTENNSFAKMNKNFENVSILYSHPVFEVWLLFFLGNKVFGYSKKEILKKFTDEINESKPYNNFFKTIVKEEQNLFLEKLNKAIRINQEKIDSEHPHTDIYIVFEKLKIID